MLVAVQDFGSIWTTRAARRAEESAARQRAFYNTTGILAGTKLQNRSCVYGYVRLDECSGFDVARATWIIHRVYETDGVSVWNGRNRLFLRHLTPKRTYPGMHLFRIRAGDVGWIDRKSAWHCDAAQLISFSEGNSQQEVLVILPAFGWIRGARGTYCVDPLQDQPWVARLSPAGK
jgi:hypothetical protein